MFNRIKHLFSKPGRYLPLAGALVLTSQAAFAADPIADAITGFDLTPIQTAGGAVIGVILAFVGITLVIRMIKKA